MPELFIKDEYLAELKSIFSYYCPNAEIWAYGSRVGGDAHEGSDLDLVVKSFGDDNCSLYELKELLNDSNIPFLIDIHEYDYLPESFCKEIDKNYVKIYYNTL
ncbi:MAG: nucleotidyltransferase domain-containing protein [Muribaculaceae bacterium]|nr:nucleotidyltransferase domain-containing protein [Muribaculaceae bacterium]